MKYFFFLSCLIFSCYPFSNVLAQAKKPIQTIIVDPGHGGLDPGAPGTISTEAQVALAISLKLGDTIAKAWPDVKLIFTRTTDELPGNKPNKDAALRYRADLANQSNGDLFIAVHCNSAGRRPGGWYEKKVIGKTPHIKTYKKGKKTYKKTVYEYQYEQVWVENKVKGTETYVWAMNKNDDKQRSVARNPEYTGEIDSTSTITLPDPNDPAEAARMLIYTQNYFRKSLSLADYVQQEFVSAGRVDRGVKQRNDKGIWVLQATGMPSILIEIGFISNKEEEEYMNSEAGQAEIVGNIFNAIKRYKERLETKAGSSPVNNETGTQKGF